MGHIHDSNMSFPQRCGWYNEKQRKTNTITEGQASRKYGYRETLQYPKQEITTMTKEDLGDSTGATSTDVTIISVLFSDQDECQTGNHNCSQLAECTNTQGSYTCSCYSGTSGNGFVCSGV